LVYGKGRRANQACRVRRKLKLTSIFYYLKKGA
jgi:hypothetical protein